MALLGSGGGGNHVIARQLSAPPASNFIRSAHQTAIVVGDYLYVDGGEVSQGENQTLTDSQDSRPVNDTLSIPLSASWTNETVPIRALDKGDAPVFKREGLWLDPSSRSFYMWGGEISYTAIPPDDAIWQFSTDGSGGGSWVKQAPAVPSTFASLMRPTEGIVVASNDTGFYLGGHLTGGTNSSISGGPWSIPGIVSFNMTTGIWANSSSTPFGGLGTDMGGSAQFMPSFGPNGLLLFLGGRSPTYAGAGSFVDFNNVTVYDPVAKSWYAQSATGQTPSVRDLFCTVGAQGQNNSFEIFLYGGTDDTVSYGDVYVLSVPGFFWSKANYTQSHGRYHHTCALAGKRQMISIGGLNHSLSGGVDPWRVGADPITRGIGVFDMTAMAWSNRYDASAEDYQSPDVVKDWYASGKLPTVQWTSDEVRALFDPSSPSQSATHSSPPGPQAPSGSHGTNAGAIAGGVVGGILLCLCIGALIWFLRRHRRRKTPNGLTPGSGRETREIEPAPQSWERTMLDGMPVTRRPELEAADQAHKSDPRGQGLYELQDNPDASR